MKKITSLIIVCLSLFSISFSAVYANSTAAAFMDNTYQPEAQALGNTGVSHQDGSSAVYWNPGLLARSSENEVGAMYYSAFETDFMALQGLWHWKKLPIGLIFNQAKTDGFLSSSINSQTGRVGLTGSSFDYKAQGLTVATAKNLTEKVSVGLGLKYISEEAATANATGFGADLGVGIQALDHVMIGAVVQNIVRPIMKWNTGSNLEESVSTKTRIGVSSTWLNDRLSLHQELVMEQGRPNFINWGAAVKAHRFLHILGGMQQSSLSLGLTLALHPLDIEFSWTTTQRDYVDDYYKFGMKFSL